MTTKENKLCNHQFIFVYEAMTFLKHYHRAVFRKKQPSNNSRFKFKYLKIRVIYEHSVPTYLHYIQFTEKKSTFLEVQVRQGHMLHFTVAHLSFRRDIKRANTNSHSRWTSNLIWDCPC